ncbi:hypothetical protein [Pseudoduganella sp. UC29_71]|jgi:hypothetical protein|uniref:hypothetical protein n=1 Tax=Pseudoduganella sp. UC29_71 TaxID=3350174 RepID=UPI00047000CC
MESIKLWLKHAIVEPISNNPALTLLAAGLLLYLAGVSKSAYLSDDWALRLKDLGLAIFSGGVFSCLLKSAQFSALFQKQILTAFYDPAKITDNKILSERWLLMTNSILRGLLPVNYEKAADAIMARFFDDSLDYHFSDFEISYNITVDANGKGTVFNTLKADLVISPRRENPIFKQNIESDSATTLISLMIDNTPVNLEQPKPAAEEGKAARKFMLELNLREHVAPGKGAVRFERTFKTIQDLHAEPFFSATISRFIKGPVAVRTKITAPYKIRFLSNGIEKDDPIPVPDGEGYLRWVLAKPGHLLLPGQGYTLIVVKN